MIEPARWAIQNLANNTAMTTTNVSDCAENTDVRFVNGELGDGTWGSARCINFRNETSNPQICDKFNVIQDRSSQVTTNNDAGDPYSNGVPANGELELNFEKTWCHELGHVTGLEHHPVDFENRAGYYNASTPDRVRDCLVRGHIETADNWRRYNAHHTADIAARY